MYRFQKPHRPVSRVFIHCSASDNPEHDNVATMDAWHRERGWSGIGYHLFIRKSGLVEDGRPLEKTPAAQSGHNRGTIAICLHGLEEQNFTEEQEVSLIDLCRQINEAYEGKVTFHGHCEVAAKSCPVIDYRRILNLNSQGRLGMGEMDATKEASDDSDEYNNFLRPLRMGDSGLAVRWLQAALRYMGVYNHRVDGQFGRHTHNAVLAFQASHHLVEDGIAGVATYEALNELCAEMKVA